ncbi:MAG: RloB domain-containing protein [Fibrobacter sp.]|nr:RloB domain-containing protein [Fibrobacter sp.]
MRRRSFRRELGNRRYKKLYLLATEGAKTEPQYFSMFNDERNLLKVKCIKHGDASAPKKLLASLKKSLHELTNNDEAWIIVDKDNWNNEQLQLLYDWSCQKKRFGFALSNPMFEYWLLLHFENGNNIESKRECVQKLKKHLPNYAKGKLELNKILPGVSSAIERAKAKDSPPCQKWPTNTGTTVYRLVEKLNINK